ncbi:uncharacterized protein TNCV_954731 [Trichonephila clavipes]|nr:uncharacterized protein TNCV_954731 [Trichonephila clavipes]
MVKSIARRRKWQLYGNKFTNTSKNSTSAVPYCAVGCFKLGNESLSTAEEMPSPVFGKIIVDLELIVEAFVQLCCPKCFAEKVELFEDSRYGLCSHFTLKCFAGVFKLCLTLNLLRLTKTAYENQESKLLKVVQKVAEESMIKAVTEIVEKKQNLSSDIVKCCISVDGTGQQRGYTSMNGCVAAISVDTGKVLDIEVICRPTVQHVRDFRLYQETLNMSRQKPTTYVSKNPEDSKPQMVTNDAKMVAKVANFVTKTDANLALPPSSH